MKISTFSSSDLSCGKCNIRDSRLDEIHRITGSKKKTYAQVEIIPEGNALEADAITAAKDSSLDLILKDLEFVETRLSRSEDEAEKNLLLKLKKTLEDEEFIFRIELSEKEKGLTSGYNLLTIKPVITFQADDLPDKDHLISQAVSESGYICFFTTGEKESRAWLIKKGTTAWEASGVIHSDIQKGFIRAEIISYKDFIDLGGEQKAKQAQKMRLEPKDYIMQDGDLVNFRFNK